MGAGCAHVKFTLVQSIPVGRFDVKPVENAIATHEALVKLADSASETLDLTAMYVDLLGAEDRKLFSDREMASFGAERGKAVFDALLRAARRGVAVRILLGTGIGDPANSSEVRALRQYPNVEARTWDPHKYYAGGIMHLKLWHSDGVAAYLGSANADWKSLAQVKEVGVLINGTVGNNNNGAVAATTATATAASTAAAANVDETAATRDLGRIYEIFWRWAEEKASTRDVWSDAFQAFLTVPPWDPAVPKEDRSASPVSHGLEALSNAHTQQPLCNPGQTTPTPHVWGLAHAFLSASPGGALSPGRTPDLDALLLTVHSATRHLSLSVMDFLPGSGYSGGHSHHPVYWPTLVDAILAVAFSKPVRVRVLVSKWAHTSDSQVAAMQRLASGLAACAHGKEEWHTKCAGTLEVRQYVVPGWNSTAKSDTRRLGVNSTARYPAFTRVNHQKYVVSEQRVNIGTSNWEWGYFHQTAGASYNTNDTLLVAAAQSVFDADWGSAYAEPCCTYA